jgi:multidrug resistance efflux pump
MTMAEMTDGPVSLRDRVQALRLPEKVDSGRGPGGGGLPWVLVLLLGASTASLAARVYTSPPGDPARDGTLLQPPAPPAGTGETAEAPPAAADAARPKEAAPGAVVLEAKGYIIPAHQIQVSPIEVGGRVVELYVEEGKRFKAGEVLAVLERTSYVAEVAEAEGALAAAQQQYLELDRGFRKEEIQQVKAELNESEAQLKQAESLYRRNLELRGAALPATEYEQSESQYRAFVKRVERLRLALALVEQGPRVERVAAAKHQVEVAKARLTKAKWRLDNCTIRAPIDGTILTKKAELGNLVNPLAFAATSGAVCEMADLSDLEVELDITERDVAKVVKGMPCRIRAEAYPDRVYEGVVDRLMPIANRAKGAVPVRVKVTLPRDEEGVYLKPEMGAVVAFLQPGKKN